MILPLHFSEKLNICRNYSLLDISAHLWCDDIKFLNHKPEEWKSFAWYHAVSINKLCFSWKLFYGCKSIPCFWRLFKDIWLALSWKSVISKIYRAEKIAKNSHSAGLSFSNRTTNEAFSSAPFLFFYNLLRRVTFMGHPVLFKLHLNIAHKMLFSFI